MEPSQDKKSQLLIPGSIVVAGLIIAFSIVYVSGGSRTVTPPGNGTNPPPPSVGVTLEDGNDAVLGNPDAKVTIVEFSDFQCPYCASFFQATLPQVKERYVSTGKAKLIYRDFPLSSIHAQAQKAAEASECAHEQGKFWEYHDLLFANQASLGVAKEKEWAAQLGLDTAKFNQCLDSGKYTSEVAKDFSDGQVAGVTGTPTFFINGKKVVGAVPFEQISAEIDAALAAVK